MNLDEIQKVLASKLKPRRYAHSLGVVDAAEKLALRYGVDVNKAMLAALLHDCGRCFNDEVLIDEALSRGISLTVMEYHAPVLIHAKLGAILAKEEYGVTDEEVLRAIELHTVAGANMTPLDKVIYLADMIEVHRAFPGVEKLREMSEKLPLDDVMLEAFNHSINFIMTKKDAIHPNTVMARNEIILNREKL